MIHATITSIATYRDPEKQIFTTSHHGLALMSRGVNTLHIHRTSLPSLPCISAVAQGALATIDATAERDNVTCLFRSDDWREADQPGTIEFRSGEDWIAIPAFVPITEEEAERWRYEFGVIATLLKSPLAVDRFRLQTRLHELLCRLLDHCAESRPPSVAVRLKELLDSEDGLAAPLHRLAQICGYSVGHVSAAFRDEFRITPKRYQQQRRLAFAMDLAVNSDLNASQIADRCGYTHLSHFSAAFSRAHGLSPSAAMRTYRR